MTTVVRNEQSHRSASGVSGRRLQICLMLAAGIQVLHQSLQGTYVTSNTLLGHVHIDTSPSTGL